MAQQFQKPVLKKLALRALIGALVVTSPSARADVADAPSAANIGQASELGGWGSYKFGMTENEVRQVSNQTWMVFASALIPDTSFTMATDDVDQYGVRFHFLLLLFDSDRHLSSIALEGALGGKAVDQCRQSFEGLLVKLEAQYGAFAPTDDIKPTSAANPLMDAVRSIPSAQSQYRDVELSVAPNAFFNADTRLYSASALKTYGVRSISAQMSVIENASLPEPVPSAVLAADPKLALPNCSLRIFFQSKAPQPVDPAALRNMMQAFAPAASTTAAAPQSIEKSVQDMASANQKFFDAAKKDGLMGPLDPIMDAYIRERSRHDDAAANALLAKMTPAQKASAAYIRHDYPLAIELWTPLAEKGDADAAASIGTLYEYGLNGVTKDNVKAVKWRSLAASEGDAGSQDAMGQHYAAGEGVPKDNVRAYMWLSAALEGAKTGPWKSWFPASIVKERDDVAAQMTAAEIAKAQAMTNRCQASHFKKCE